MTPLPGVNFAVAASDDEDLGGGFIQVQERLHVALCDIAEAELHFNDQALSARFAWICSEQAPRRKSRSEPEDPPSFSRPCKFGDIFRFCQEVKKFQRSNPLETLVICTSRRADSIEETTFLVASYMLLFQQTTVDQALSFLCLLSTLMKTAVHALHHTKSLNWINLPANMEERDSGAESPSAVKDRIFLNEYLYYDDLNHADMHVLVPGRLLAFTSPVDIPSVTFPGRASTNPRTDYCSRRRFNTKYFLDIFDYFMVKLVLSFTQGLYNTT